MGPIFDLIEIETDLVRFETQRHGGDIKSPCIFGLPLRRFDFNQVKKPVPYPLRTDKGFTGVPSVTICPPWGQMNGSLLVVFCTKRETYFSEWVSGKLQCEAFIGPRRVPVKSICDKLRPEVNCDRNRRARLLKKQPYKLCTACPIKLYHGRVSRTRSVIPIARGYKLIDKSVQSLYGLGFERGPFDSCRNLLVQTPKKTACKNGQFFLSHTGFRVPTRRNFSNSGCNVRFSGQTYRSRYPAQKNPPRTPASGFRPAGIFPMSNSG